jgi:hypothetical protein
MWLEQRISSGVRIHTDRMPNSGRAVLITMQSGPGLELEGELDNVAFNIQARGAENNFDDAFDIAWEIDSLITTEGVMGFTMGDTVVHMMDRVGGGPAPLSTTDPSGRYGFSGNYFAKVFV